MPDYDISDENHTEVTLYGELIAQNGSATKEDIVNLLMPTLSPDEPLEKRLKK